MLVIWSKTEKKYYNRNLNETYIEKKIYFGIEIVVYCSGKFYIKKNRHVSQRIYFKPKRKTENEYANPFLRVVFIKCLSRKDIILHPLLSSGFF